MGKIKFDYSNAKDFIRDHEIDKAGTHRLCGILQKNNRL